MSLMEVGHFKSKRVDVKANTYMSNLNQAFSHDHNYISFNNFVKDKTDEKMHKY